MTISSGSMIMGLITNHMLVHVDALNLMNSVQWVHYVIVYSISGKLMTISSGSMTMGLITITC